jgi:hypothetical protein
MPQLSLPFFPEESTLISAHLAVQKNVKTVFYFNGPMPVFQHSENDYASFRMITSQFVVNGNCKQMDIVRCFGVSSISVKRWVKKYRKEGIKSFYEKKTSGEHGS